MNICIALKKNGERCLYKSKDDCEYCRIHQDKQNCTICLEKINNKKIELSCNHIFHRDCLREWMKQKPSCPVCRRDIPVDKNDLEIVTALEEKRIDRENQQITDDNELARMIQEEANVGAPDYDNVYNYVGDNYVGDNYVVMGNAMEENAMGRLFSVIQLFIDGQLDGQFSGELDG